MKELPKVYDPRDVESRIYKMWMDGDCFRAEIDLPASQAGRRWLGLRLHGTDGSIEDWPAQPVRIVEEGGGG